MRKHLRPDELRAFLGEVRSRPGLKGRERVSDYTVFAYHRTLAAFYQETGNPVLAARHHAIAQRLGEKKAP